MSDVAAVEETVKRLSSHKGVVGIVIVNGDGVPIRTTLDQELAVQYAALVSQLTLKVRHMVRELAEDGADDLQFLRVRSKRHEIMIAPGFDKVRCARQGGAGEAGSLWAWQPCWRDWLSCCWPMTAFPHGKAAPRQRQRSQPVVGAATAHRSPNQTGPQTPTTPALQDHNYTLLVVQTPQAD